MLSLKPRLLSLVQVDGEAKGRERGWNEPDFEEDKRYDGKVHGQMSSLRLPCRFSATHVKNLSLASR